MTIAEYVIPAPPDGGKPFQLGAELTVYEAAVIYAGRHPCGGFLRDADYNDYVQFLQTVYPTGPRSRSAARARKRWDICCDIVERIKRGAIQPVRPAFRPSGEIDIVRTTIKTSDLVDLATSRGERPRHLRHLQAAPQSIAPTGQPEGEPPPPPGTRSTPNRHGPTPGTIDRYGAADRGSFQKWNDLSSS